VTVRCYLISVVPAVPHRESGGMLELTLHVGLGTDPSIVSEILLNLGALCVTSQDRNAGTASEQPIFHEPSPDEDVCRTAGLPQSLWTQSVLTACFPVSTSIEDVTMALFSDFDMPTTPEFTVVNSSPVPDHILAKDWVSHVHQNFAAVQIDNLCVRAPWHTAVSGVADGRQELVIEPGQAFGTGEHPTTQLVVRWVCQFAENRSGADAPWTVLDYGCGSGILALAAVRFGADRAVGCDIDSRAVQTAVRNAKTNSCDHVAKFGSNSFEAQLFDGCGYDVVLANILAGPLKTLAPLLASRVAPGGRIALSGILASQALDVSATYSSEGLKMEDAVVRAGWALLVGSRPP
jgi:ribosomal protein L11 methyltransferase